MPGSGVLVNKNMGNCEFSVCEISKYVHSKLYLYKIT